MPSVTDLWDNFDEGNLCFIVGTGPSLRLINQSLISTDSCVIGLNQAWKSLERRPDATLTIHAHEPEVMPQDPQEAAEVCGAIITKEKGPLDHWSRDVSYTRSPHSPVYIFKNNPNVQDFTYVYQRHDGRLYTGRGIQATALCLAAHMGFKNCILVGCDMCDLSGDHHSIDGHHYRSHGLRMEDIYREYYECTAKVRDIVEKNHGMIVSSLTPFLGLGNHVEEYERLKSLRGLDPVPDQWDTSAYTRTVDVFR